MKATLQVILEIALTEAPAHLAQLSQDEIIKEVRAIREAYAEQFGFDIQAI